MADVRGAFSREVCYCLGYAVATLLLAASIVPVLYAVGGFLGDCSQRAGSGEFASSGVWNWLGERCARAPYHRYFKRALLLSALLLLPFFIRLLKQPRLHAGLFPCSSLWRDCLVGFGLGAGSMALCVWVVYALGWVVPEVEVEWYRCFISFLLSALVIACLEEWFFRGVLLSLFMRAVSLNWAVFWSAVFFVLGHSLDSSHSLAMDDLESPWAGFVLLGLLFTGATDVVEQAPKWVSLAMIAWLLSEARLRSGGLWLSIGLHMGWVMAIKWSQELVDSKSFAVPSRRVWMGSELWTGLLPWVSLLLVLVVLRIYLAGRGGAREVESLSGGKSSERGKGSE